MPGRRTSWALLLALGLLAVGAASFGAANAPTIRSARLPPSATRSGSTTTGSVPSSTTTTALARSGAASTVPPGPPPPAPPGPLAVDAAAWAGNGDLAFVSEGTLEVLGDGGSLTAVTGPSGGFDSNPAWSPDGQWLAFLHSVPAGPYAVAPATLWLVHHGQSVAREVTPSGVGRFAWSPVAPVLAFATAPGAGAPSPDNLFTDVPGQAPVRLAGVGPGFGVENLAWSPGGSTIAYDDVVAGRAATATTPPVTPVMSIGTVPAVGGAPTTVYQRTDGTGLTLAGWWPNGGGLLFWEAPGGGNLPDGKPLYALAAGSTQPVPLAQGLARPFALAADPVASTEAVVAGLNRSIWAAGRGIDLCPLPAGSCEPIAVPAGDEALAPSFTSSGTLIYATASVSGPFGQEGGADWTAGYLAEWDATNQLWALPPGGTPAPLSQAGAGSLLGQPAASGDRLLVVRDDALWLASLGSSSPAVRVAGPLFSNAAPSGYYGEVDWAGTFAWSEASGPRGGSADLMDAGFYPPIDEVP